MRRNITSSSSASQPQDTKLLEAYSVPPLVYDIRGFCILTLAYQSTLWSQIAFFAKNMGKRHLDVAVGTGTLLFLILKWRALKKMPMSEVTAIDYVPTMLEGGKKFFKNNPHVHLEVGDAAKLAYTSDTFDTVNIANSIHCFSDIHTALEETFRVLRPGGTFASNTLLYPKGYWPLRSIAQAINDWGIRKGILHTPYQADDIRKKIVDAGFEILSEKITGNCLNLLAKKPS